MRITKEDIIMTIHTFEVSAMLTNENYYKIQQELKLQDKDKWKAVKNGMQYWDYPIKEF